MSYDTLLQAKAHLLVIHDDDDVLIQQNIDAAESRAADYMNRPEIADDPVNPWKRNQGSVADWSRPLHDCRPYTPPVVSSEEPDPVPKVVVQAILLATADFYENRTSTTIGAMTQTNNAVFENLLWPHRVGMGI